MFKDSVRVENLDLCKCGNCLLGKRKVDYLCCFEVHALNSKFDTEKTSCIIQSNEFEMLCTSEIVLKNVLIGLHETRRDHLGYNFSNRLLGYSTYKQYIWWVFKHLGKGNRKVIPSCTLWKFREHFPEPNTDYVSCSESKKD